MSVDSYAPCPCGSGKKFKFCCQVISDEMDRIVRLIEGNQPRVAIQQLEQLAKKHPQNAWVGTTQAMVLLDLNEPAFARDVLKQLLEFHPDNELAIVLYAAALIREDGFEVAKRAIHRAFQKSAKKLPALVGDLASSYAAMHASEGHMMAAREHLALALRLAPEDKRQQLFVQLLELDGSDDILYPLRGSHMLPTITGSDELQKEVRKGQKYAAIGCWSTAADVFTALADATPERAELWHAVGLCRAWDGNEKIAAESLHRAARHYADQGTAIECETLAQILDAKTSTDVIEQCHYTANITSVSRLLTVLDSVPQFERVKNTPESDVVTPVAVYLALNTDKKLTDGRELTRDTVPVIQAQITVFDSDPKTSKPAVAMISGFRGQALDDVKAAWTTAAGDLFEWKTDVPQPEIANAIPTEAMVLECRWYLADEVPQVRRRELLNQYWSQTAHEKWSQLPLRALGGKTPAQGVSDPSLQVPLYGAVFALDAGLQRRSYGLDINQLLTSLKVTPLPELEVTDETNVGALSIMQLHRLPVKKLNDQQLNTVVNRSMLIQHSESLYQVLTEALARPSCAEQFDRARILRTLSEISASKERREEAFSWIDQGRKLPVPEGKTAFQHAWTWDMAELGMRLEDPSDPHLKALLNRFVTYYSPKVPQIRPHIEQMLQGFGVPSPWNSVEFSLAGSIATPEQGWSQEAAAPAAAGGSKLWLPGQ